MQIRSTHKALLFFIVLIAATVHAAVVTRVTTFTDGSVLYASDLNSEFNNLVNNINALDNDNLSATANISPAKISAAIDGDGITRNGGTGALSANVDDTTIEIVSDNLQVKNNSITNAKLRQSAGLSIVGNSTNSTANVADITAASDSTVLQRSGTSLTFATIPTAAIANNAVTRAKLEAVGHQVSSSSGNYSATCAGNSFVDMTNLTVTITTTGRPVMIMTIGDGTSGYSSGFWKKQSTSAATNPLSIALVKDSTEIQRIGFIGELSSSSPFYSMFGNVHFIDTPTAGTYTYKLRAACYVKGNDGVGDFSAIDTGVRTYGASYLKLVAYEL